MVNIVTIGRTCLMTFNGWEDENLKETINFLIGLKVCFEVECNEYAPSTISFDREEWEKVAEPIKAWLIEAYAHLYNMGFFKRRC